MAQIGLRRFRYAPMHVSELGVVTYDAPATLAGAIESKVSLNILEAKLHSDDVLKDKVTEFADGTLTMGVDEDDDAIFSPLLGERTETYTVGSGSSAKSTTVYKSNVDDVPIFFGFGQVVPKRIAGVKKFKVEWFPKVQFKPYHNDATTKKDSLEFTTPSIEGSIFAGADGDWRKRATFDTESEANTFLDYLFTQSTQSNDNNE